MTNLFQHMAVLVKEAVELLITSQEGIYIDATIGFGSHSKEILSRLGEKAKVIGVDRDAQAIKFLEKNLIDKRLILKKGNFSELKKLLQELDIIIVDGVLFDLGVSLYQLKNSERGFSFHSDSYLDMRMDKSEPLTAWYVINKYPQNKLERIFLEYGEERFSKKISQAIVRQRQRKSIDTCRELSKIIEEIYLHRGKIHPATKVFQAIRIEVNKELKNLQEGLVSAFELLKQEGRLCVISYHSLEDRIVKGFFKEMVGKGKLRVITKKPITPSDEEVKVNPSSRSAKLRAGERL
ncbi:MAG: 16S rRNA (cytosine(1402)-N(4))-methyltransferase RsmH [Thermodesulfovibrionales bacterium]|nr:16S rRNA (cytosine(1402)-N(4))-methyltransferase RsmH [Thermodesulfovibrionales bacterium]